MKQSKKAGGFAQHLPPRLATWRRIHAKHAELSGGFIPMIIMIIMILGALVWFVYSRVSTAN